MDEHIGVAFIASFYCVLVVLSFLLDKRPC